MRVLLIDADGHKGFPNLALMKISTHLKGQGDKITLIKGIPSTAPLESYGFAYMSLIFPQNRPHAMDYLNQLGCPFTVGGSGFDLKTRLPDDIEHLLPDYALYDTDFSMGFTSRGCIRNCAFCIVSEKEGPIHNHAPVTEFHDPSHSKLVLLDNNFLASPRFTENIQYIIDQGLKVNINQGLDVRLLTQENLSLLLEAKCHDWQFKKRKLHFAFDDVRYEPAVRRGITLLREAGLSKSFLRQNVIFYVLVGFNSKIEEDLYRVNVLIEEGVGPFIMRYNSVVGPHRFLLHLSRWVNRKIFQHTKLEDHDYSDSKASYEAIFNHASCVGAGTDTQHPGMRADPQPCFLSKASNRKGTEPDYLGPHSQQSNTTRRK